MRKPRFAEQEQGAFILRDTTDERLDHAAYLARRALALVWFNLFRPDLKHGTGYASLEGLQPWDYKH